jgi:hypothetical protein
MAKSKDQLLDEAKKAGRVPDDVDADEFTASQLEGIVSGSGFEFDNRMHSKPIVAPDGHVVLSQEDIDARNKS